MTPPGVKLSAMTVARDIVKNEGILSFMKGVHSPLAMTAFTNALAFMGYGIGLQLLVPGSDGRPNKQYTYMQHFLAGALSGAFQAFVMSPTQLIKVKLQIQTGKKPAPGEVVYKGPVDCLLQILKTEGFDGLFKGLWVCTLRDTWGFAVYYWSYQYFKNLCIDDLQMASSFAMLLSGAITGVVAWVAEYPLDVLKTRIQCQPPHAPKETLSILYQTKDLWRNGGLMAFYVGVGTTIARAVPVDAALFYSYEVVLKYLNLMEDKFLGLK
jgi:solute carrier family 25 carnitine/acylcarnitine transporter 20/29